MLAPCTRLSLVAFVGEELELRLRYWLPGSDYIVNEALSGFALPVETRERTDLVGDEL